MSDTLGLTDEEYDYYQQIMYNGGFSQHLHSFCDYVWSYELTKLFIEHGANVNSVGSNGRTPLTESVINWMNFDVRIVKLLLDNSAHVNKAHSKTALDVLLSHCVNQRQRKHALLLLLQHGAIALVKWDKQTETREFYFTVRSFLVLMHHTALPNDILRVLHAFIIG
jgi:ankyrin repeat protein